MESTEASQLLESVDQASHSARAARHAYWFPLVLFGLIILSTLFFFAPPGPGPSSCPKGQVLAPLALGNGICRGTPAHLDALLGAFGGSAVPPVGRGIVW